MTVMPKPKTPSPDDQSDDSDWYARSIRFPAEVWEALAADAKKHRRPVNQHLLWIAERYLGLANDGCNSAE